MEFKDRLVQLRKRTKLLQADMAKKIGVARATYGAYEQGTREPDFETLQQIADFFGVSTDYLLGHSVDDNKRTVMGEKIDLATLTENERIVLDWAMNQEALSFSGDKEDLKKILERLSIIFEYEKMQANNKENNNGRKN